MIAGTCYNGLTEAECLAASGTYGGDGTSCDEVPDLGACWVNGVCVGDGLTEAACLAQGGSWRGSSALCGDPPPPDDPVTGACCEVSGVCTDGVTEAACTGAGGTWQGANTTCVQLQWVLAAVVTVGDVSQASSVAAGSHVAGRYFVRYKQGAYRYADVAWSAHGIYLEFGGGNTNWICGVPTVQSSAAAVQTYYNSLAVRPTEYFNHGGGNMTLKFGDSYYGDNLLGTNPPQFEIWREDTVAIDCCDVAVTQADEALVSPNGHSVTSTIAAAVITGGAAPLTTVYEALYNNSVMRVVADPSVTARVWQMGVTQMRVTVTDANGCTAVDYFTVTVTAGPVLDCDVPSYELTLTEGVGDESVLLTAGTEVCTLTRTDSCVYFGQMFGANVNGLWWFDLTYDAGNNRWELLVYPSGNPSQSAFRRSGETAVGAFTYFSGGWAVASVISLA